MQIQTIKNIPFTGKEINNKNKSATGNKIAGIKEDAYEYFSKQYLYEAQKLSSGREKEDGKYKTTALLTGLGAVAASLTAFLKSIKSLNINKKLNKAIKNSASAERIEELKTAALKKQKGSTIALGLSLTFTFASIGAWAKNKFEADKTAKERNFMPDKELNQKTVQDKDTIDKALKDTVIKDAEIKETKAKELVETKVEENKDEDNKKPVE